MGELCGFVFYNNIELFVCCGSLEGDNGLWSKKGLKMSNKMWVWVGGEEDKKYEG